MQKNSLLYLFKAICFFFLLGIFFSYDAWANIRSFPTFPVLKDFILPYPFDKVLRGLLILSLLFLVIHKQQKILYTFFIFLISILFLDQIRWQPWVYFYSLLLLPYIFNQKEKYIKDYVHICFIGLYLWSGINKLNPNFDNYILETVLILFLKIKNPETIEFLKKLGFLFALFEILIAFLLYSKKYRKKGVYLAIILHTFIILYILTGIKGNYVIIPWNIFMILAILLLFYKDSSNIELTSKKAFSKVLTIILSLVFLAPIGNFFNKWDTSLSFSLYDGKAKNGYLLIEESVVSSIKNSENSYFFLNTENQNDIVVLDIGYWSSYSTKVPFYAEDRFIKDFRDIFCKRDSLKGKIMLVQTPLPLWKKGLSEILKIPKDSLNFKALENIPPNSNFKKFSCK